MGLFDFFKSNKPVEIVQEQAQLDKSLEKSKSSLFSKLSRSLVGKSTVDEEVLDNLEEILIGADVGVPTTVKIIGRIEKRVSQDKYLNANQLQDILKEEIAALLEENQSGDFQNTLKDMQPVPYVILVVGVNGVGKTTTIGKLAHKFTQSGKTVVLGAGDTFRAAAAEQLTIWGQRVGARVVSQQTGSDPASVAYDTLSSAIAGKEDICIIDTAGRLHNKIGLMNELTKIKQVMAKLVPAAPHEILLVLDASTGQNAIEQARQFTAATNVNALAVTKLDGTAKGGVVIGISDEFKVPVKYIGVGEGINDLQLFDRISFVNAFFGIGAAGTRQE